MRLGVLATIYRIADPANSTPKSRHARVPPPRPRRSAAGMVPQNISNAINGAACRFLTRHNQVMFADALAKELAPHFAKIGC